MLTVGRFFDVVMLVRDRMHMEPSWRRDCSVFVRDVCRELARVDSDNFDPLWNIHTDANGIVPASRVWGPALAASAMFGGRVSSADPQLPSRLSVCQGWHDLSAGGVADVPGGDRGHAWFWLVVGEYREGIRIDSSRRRGVRIHDLSGWGPLRNMYDAGIRHSPVITEEEG